MTFDSADSCWYYRRYFGHKPTIRPNAKKLSKIFLNRNNMTWEEFSFEVRKHQKGFMGEPKEVRPGRGQFHENPSACICEDSAAKAEAELKLRKFGTGNSTPNTLVPGSVEVQNNSSQQEQEWSDQEEEEEEEDDMSDFQTISQLNGTSNDYDGGSSEEPELEELLSD